MDLFENSSFTNATNSTTAGFYGPKRWWMLALIIIIIATAVGNLLVCLAVCWERRLQNMTNYFLLSLAIADLLVSILVMPMGMIVEIYGFFPTNPYLCVLWVTMDVLLCTASIWHMCTMSMDRFFTLKYPMRYGRNKTRKMVAVKILFVWVVSFGVSSPVCVLGVLDKRHVFNEGFCVPTLVNFVVYGSIFAFYVPLTIMLITYVLTIQILWNNQRLVKQIHQSDLQPCLPHSIRKPRKKKPFIHITTPSSQDGSSRATYSDFSANYSDSHNDCRGSSLQQSLSKHSAPNKHSSNGLTKHRSQRSSAPDVTQSISQTFESCPHNNESQQVGNLHDSNLDNHDPVKNEVSIRDEAIALKYENNVINSESKSASNRELAVCETASELKEDMSLNVKISPKCSNYSNKQLEFMFPVRPTITKSKSDRTITKSLSDSCSSSITNRRNLDRLDLKPVNLMETNSKSCEFFFTMGPSSRSSFMDERWLEIQREMDMCLQEGNRNEAAAGLMEEKMVQTNETAIQSPAQTYITNQNYKGLESDIDITEDDDDDDNEQGGVTSTNESESESELLTIKLHPEALYMYKLGANSKNIIQSPSASLEQETEFLSPKMHNHPHYKTRSKAYRTSQGILKCNSYENHPIKRKRRSVKDFMREKLPLAHVKLKRKFSQLLPRKTANNERKASKVLGIIFAVFVILWTPFFLTNIMSVTCQSCMSGITPELMSTFLWMGYVASLANPIIYTMFNTAFRHAFIKILRCKYRGEQRRADSAAMLTWAATWASERRNTVTVMLDR